MGKDDGILFAPKPFDPGPGIEFRFQVHFLQGSAIRKDDGFRQGFSPFAPFMPKIRAVRSFDNGVFPKRS